MSASLNNQDKNWLLGITPSDRKLNQYEETLILASFDEQTDYDIEKIENEMNEIKFLKRVCLIKLILFIPEYFFVSLFFKKKYKEMKIKVTKLYWNFLFNNISLEKLQTELILLHRAGNI